jgi:hypothetical protein
MLLKSTLLLTGFLLANAHWAFAQTKEAVKKQISVDVCDCLTAKSAEAKPESLPKDQIQQVFVQCFGSAAGKHMKSIQQAYGQAAFSDKTTMRTLGEEVGALLVQNCPVSMGYFMAMSDKGSSSTQEAATTGQTVGKLGALSKPGVGLPLLEVQANKAEKAYFAWVRQFDKAEEMLGNLPKLKGQQARISWEEVEILQPDTQKYQKVREITGIELL